MCIPIVELCGGGPPRGGPYSRGPYSRVGGPPRFPVVSADCLIALVTTGGDLMAQGPLTTTTIITESCSNRFIRISKHN
ncbi:hypothetical protein R1flu_016317 [Riccia fluitans]|uniref:Uncharacterized protein n=1 Tax=Riccia fluitans TaxID=41844 RepID=A0ABD1YLJ5_9MARC